MVKFTSQDHRYSSIDGSDHPWISVTTLLHGLCTPFIAKAAANRSTKKEGSKWYGVPVDEILDAWDQENNRSLDLGRWYHDVREQQHLKRANSVLCDIRDGVKYAPSQSLAKGMVYPEHMIYLQSAWLTGQSDIVECTDKGVVNVSDYKTSKKINRKGFMRWDGTTEKMLGPVRHMDKCEYNMYTLQLSMYMYMIIRHNPSFIPGKMEIEHILFEEEGRDRWGYPIYRMNNGEYIVRDIVKIDIPYRKAEVQNIINWIKSDDNRDRILAAKHKG